MAAERPTVVIVPGAWTVPAAYRKLVDVLKAKSFDVRIPALPTNNGIRPPNSSFEADVAAVRAIVEPLVQDSKEVFMLMHSYGGSVGTNAVGGLAVKDRQAKNLPGGVVHLLYLSAYLLAKGQSVWKVVEKSGIMEEVRPHITFEEDGTWFLGNPIWAMYHDLDPADQEEQKSLLQIQNFSAVKGEVTYEAWRDIPSTYVYTPEDRCMPALYQDICIGNTKEAGIPLNVVVFENCAHSAYVKHPKEVADIVVKASKSD
ncbi:alpha/beta-hydrolase [Hypoxylon trugodes]|uniref:alpha/beta-hydrolase n=1 Tax=Hypoxylon trugodes TaxID=326681 RepID=UPI00218CF2F4|nr:alpha/beta-hydrolase [Hypoxylon trugodes]KAI1393990.1 alpha/beta-hydrolase [Hypoxylon trugodes]